MSELHHQSPRDFLRQSPRLRQVQGALGRQALRRFGRRPHLADPESRRNAFYAMCCRCDWQREHDTSQGATDVAMRHALNTHGDAFSGFVRVEAR